MPLSGRRGRTTSLRTGRSHETAGNEFDATSGARLFKGSWGTRKPVVGCHPGVAYPLSLVGGCVEVPPAAPEEQRRPPRTLVVGRLSRLVLEKDPVSFVLAAPMVAAALTADGTYDAVRFVLGGDDDAGVLAYLKDLAVSAGADVEFYGHVSRSNLWTFLRSLDIFRVGIRPPFLAYPLEFVKIFAPLVASNSFPAMSWDRPVRRLLVVSRRPERRSS